MPPKKKSPKSKKKQMNPWEHAVMVAKNEGGNFGPSATETEQSKTTSGTAAHRAWWKKKKAQGIKPTSKKRVPKGSKSLGDPWWKQHNV